VQQGYKSTTLVYLPGETRRRQAPCRRNKHIRIKAIVDNFDNYTITDYLTAL